MHWNVPCWQGPQYYRTGARDRETGENLSGLVRDPGFPENPAGPQSAPSRRALPSEPVRSTGTPSRLACNRDMARARAVVEACKNLNFKDFDL